MKKYYIVLNVPDDFVPEEMGMEVTYPTDITIDKEGFVANLDQLSRRRSGLGRFRTTASQYG